jgi:hypothetical protein
MKVPCHFCGNEIDTRSHTAYRKKTGWAQNRSGGGTNALALPEEHDEWACMICVDKKKRGIAIEQATLL